MLTELLVRSAACLALPADHPGSWSVARGSWNMNIHIQAPKPCDWLSRLRSSILETCITQAWSRSWTSCTSTTVLSDGSWFCPASAPGSRVDRTHQCCSWQTTFGEAFHAATSSQLASLNFRPLQQTPRLLCRDIIIIDIEMHAAKLLILGFFS